MAAARPAGSKNEPLIWTAEIARSKSWNRPGSTGSGVVQNLSSPP